MMSFYNGPNERSIGVTYTNDFVAYGLPGLKTSLWYIKGMGIDGSHYAGGPNGIYTSVLKQQGESHYEVGAYASYTVQSGTFKNISLSSSYSWHRASEYQLEGNLEEFRLIVNVPIKVF
ncbi:Porin D [Pseudomonas fluorescens]|uniref:Porin D n=1 Tax=Pseudomonas fluorescens TaxID=294 RepID=A0A5E7DNP1_PSEFL|nr:Porin D [Pseudomonas fluorescens]